MKKLALVSGATGGIGSVITERLWLEGYSILALGYSPTKVNALNDWFYEHQRGKQYGFALAMDLHQHADLWRIHNLLQSTLKDTPLTLLALCHGAAPAPGPALHAEMTLRRVMEIDVFGTYALCALASRYMTEQRQGSIVVLSSIHSRMTYPARVPYATAKAALGGMARALAVELGSHNVRVNAICPWQVRGERSQRFADAMRGETGENLYELYKQRSPMRRLIEPEEIAETILWLTRTPSVTGQEIVLDSGVSSSMWFKPFLDDTESFVVREDGIMYRRLPTGYKPSGE